MWYDVLLDGPRKHQQVELLQQVIRNVGAAGIRVFGYNFSVAGVCGRRERPVARGGAMTVVVDGTDETPLPNGMAWNMVYDPDAPEGSVACFTHDELWRRLQWFLENLLPVAEEADVRLAAHPDDPPMPVVRNTPRLVYQPDMYQRLLDLSPSRCNAMEYCLGTLAEMTEGDLYEATDRYSRTGRIAYVHFRNVRGKVPHYQEVFLDEGDIDMIRVLRILRKNNYDGVLVPDHTPLMTCNAPWHAGMAYAMGFIRAAMKAVCEE
jgi:mannonate dehydratase